MDMESFLCARVEELEVGGFWVVGKKKVIFFFFLNKKKKTHPARVTSFTRVLG
jgi:hypothetical protein